MYQHQWCTMNLQTPRKRWKQRVSTQLQVSCSSSQLMQLTQDGNVEKVGEFLTSLQAETLVNVINHVNDEQGRAPLHEAARSGDERLVKQLITYGASVHTAAADGKQALHFAAKHYRESMANPSQNYTHFGESKIGSCIQVLLNSGADVNAEDHFQTTALHLACERGNSSAVQELLAVQGINLKALNYRKMTPLHEAARHGHRQIVGDILNASKWVEDVIKLTDEKLCTPLMLASQGGYVETCKAILNFSQNLSPNQVLWQLLAKNDDLCTVLHAAVESGSCETARLILEKWKCHQQHADDFPFKTLNLPENETKQKYVDLHRCDGKTSLHMAVNEGNLEMVEMLLKHDASVNASTKENETSLHFAALLNRADIISVLLASGGSLEISDAEGLTPLLVACRSGHVGATKSLLENGAKFTATDQSERNCLILATKSGNLETVQEILSMVGQSLLNDSDRTGDTALHIAAEQGMLAIVQALLAKQLQLNRRNQNQHTPLLVAALNGRLAVVQEIVSNHRSTLNHQDEQSRTALHLAALNGHSKVVSALLCLGANVFHFDDKRQTALDMSVIGGWVDCATVLLEADENLVNNKSRSGHTSLLLACKMGKPDLVNLLLKHNANVKDRLSDGRNALDLAIDNRNEKCALELVKHGSWKESLRNATEYEDCLLTPFRKLVEKMPDVAEVVLTKSMVISEAGLENKNCEITFDYEILDDEYEIPCWVFLEDDETKDANHQIAANNLKNLNNDACIDTCSNDDQYSSDGRLAKLSQPYEARSTILLENHALKFMVNSKRERLLRHPTVTSWINYKWRKFGRYIYWANLLTYLLYLVSFNTYLMTTPPRFAVNETNFHDAECVRIRTEAQSVWGSDCLQNSSRRHIFSVLVMSISIVQLLKKFIQLIHHRLKFFLNWINYMEVTLYVLSLLVFIDFERSLHDTEIRQRWQWECGAFAVLLSWFNLLLYIRRSKWLGIYVFMIGNVGVTFIRFASIFVLFLLAFSLSFYVLLQNQIAFTTPGWAGVQTFTMMLGELNYPTVFLSHFTSSGYHEIVQYQEATIFVFIVFSIVMNLLLTNLLVEGILDLNYAAPTFLRRRWMVRERRVMPNQYEESNFFWRWYNKEDNLKLKVINETIATNESDLEKLRSEVKELKTDLKKVLYTLSDMSKGKGIAS